MVTWGDYYGNECIHHTQARDCRICTPTSDDILPHSHWWLVAIALEVALGAWLIGPAWDQMMQPYPRPAVTEAVR